MDRSKSLEGGIGKPGFFTLSPIIIFIVIRYFFPSHSKNWIAQSTSQFHNPISTPLLPQHHNIHFTIACSIFISHQNLSLNHLRMCFPIQCFNKSMVPGHFQSSFQCSRSFSISAYHNRFKKPPDTKPFENCFNHYYLFISITNMFIVYTICYYTPYSAIIPPKVVLTHFSK